MKEFVKKFKADIKQYGKIGIIKRIIKRIILLCGIKYNRKYYLVNEINYPNLKKIWEKNPIPHIIELSADDFKKGDLSYFTPERMALIQKRLSSSDFAAYGIIERGKLIYSCMLSFTKLCSSDKIIEGTLPADTALMIDAYCAPEVRGKNYHGRMIIFRLMKCYEKGKKKCIGIVLKENTPALKAQLAAGGKIAFLYYIITIWGKSYTNFFKKQQECLH